MLQVGPRYCATRDTAQRRVPCDGAFAHVLQMKTACKEAPIYLWESLDAFHDLKAGGARDRKEGGAEGGDGGEGGGEGGGGGGRRGGRDRNKGGDKNAGDKVGRYCYASARINAARGDVSLAPLMFVFGLACAR